MTTLLTELTNLYVTARALLRKSLDSITIDITVLTTADPPVCRRIG